MKKLQNLEFYKIDIENINARFKKEKENLQEFLNFANDNLNLFKSLNNKKIDKRLINKLNINNNFYFNFTVYNTLSYDLKVYFKDNITYDKRYKYDLATKDYILVKEKNNYLKNSQEKFYFRVKDKYYFDFDLFLNDLNTIQKRIEKINNLLKNQKSTINKVIKLNNDLYNLSIDNDIINDLFFND